MQSVTLPTPNLTNTLVDGNKEFRLCSRSRSGPLLKQRGRLAQIQVFRKTVPPLWAKGLSGVGVSTVPGVPEEQDDTPEQCEVSDNEFMTGLLTEGSRQEGAARTVAGWRESPRPLPVQAPHCLPVPPIGRSKADTQGEARGAQPCRSASRTGRDPRRSGRWRVTTWETQKCREPRGELAAVRTTWWQQGCKRP